MLNQENDDFPGGLRSGRPMHNSTAHGSAGNNLPDLSSITPHLTKPLVRLTSPPSLSMRARWVRVKVPD